jgi:hypothetical protein
MHLSSIEPKVQGHSDYPTWLVGETRSVERSFARIEPLLSAPAPHQECWRQELATVVMQWRIAMLDAQLRGAIPARYCEFHRWYMGVIETLTACGDAVTCYIHRKDERDAEVVLRLALKRLAMAYRAWQELNLRLSALATPESVAITEPAQNTLPT